VPKVHVDKDTYNLLLKIKGEALVRGERLTMTEIIRRALEHYITSNKVPKVSSNEVTRETSTQVPVVVPKETRGVPKVVPKEVPKATSSKATRETEHYMEPIAGKRATPEEVFIDVIRLLQMAGWKVRIGSKISVQTLNKAILKVRSSTDMRTARKYRTMFLKMGWLEGSTPNFYELTERGYNLIKSRIRLEDDDPLLDAIPIHELEKKAKEVWGVLKDWGIPSPRNVSEEVLKKALEEAGVNPVQLKLMQNAGLIRRTDKGYDITI